MLPFITLDYLTDVSNGDREEMREFSVLYVRTITKNLKTLTRAVTQKKYEVIASTAHSAAGSSAVIGMSAISALFKDMERAGVQKDVSKISALLSALEAAFSQIHDFLTAEGLLPTSRAKAK